MTPYSKYFELIYTNFNFIHWIHIYHVHFVAYAQCPIVKIIIFFCRPNLLCFLSNVSWNPVFCLLKSVCQHGNNNNNILAFFSDHFIWMFTSIYKMIQELGYYVKLYFFKRVYL